MKVTIYKGKLSEIIEQMKKEISDGKDLASNKEHENK